MFKCKATFERAVRERGFCLPAGADEAGRGCLFGPVFAAAVILSPDRPIRGLRDSKDLTAERREALAPRIRERAVAWAVAAADPFEIDRHNIYHASRLAIRRAIQRLSPAPDFLLIDALRIDLPIPQQPLIHGDARCQAIAAASILAKVARDACMAAWDPVFPQYGLAQNKGYGTPDHVKALAEFGPTALHRFSYEPVRAACPHMVWSGYPVPQQQELFAAWAEAEGAGAECP
ncbi:MAG TPA: ribonuclease HII [Bryobacteraceae bacterium]|nr:ribonuclease HII [Bryobacteraceae bacterium]